MQREIYRVAQKSVKLKHYLVLMRMLRFKPSIQSVERPHRIVGCVLNMQQLPVSSHTCVPPVSPTSCRQNWRVSYSPTVQTIDRTAAPHTSVLPFSLQLCRPNGRPNCVCMGRHELSSLARTLGSWVRIPLKARMFGVCVCMCLFFVRVVLCLGRGLATRWSLVQGVLPSVKNDYGTE
jgi:hypothetical protein